MCLEIDRNTYLASILRIGYKTKTQSSQCDTLIQCQNYENQHFQPHLWPSSVVVD